VALTHSHENICLFTTCLIMLISTRCIYNLLAHAFSQLCMCDQAQMQRLCICLISHSLPLLIAQSGCTHGSERPLVYVLGGAALKPCAHAARCLPCSHAYGQGHRSAEQALPGHLAFHYVVWADGCRPKFTLCMRARAKLCMLYLHTPGLHVVQRPKGVLVIKVLFCSCFGVPTDACDMG